MVDEGVPIYVVNRSARILGKSHLLVLEFPNPTGGRGSTVKLPPIKYPINLSRRVAPPSAIPMSRDFIDWVNRGVLEIILPEQAKEILSDPEARAAIRGAYDKMDQKRGMAAGMREAPNFNVRSGGQRETNAVADLNEAGLTAADFMGTTPESVRGPLPSQQMAAPQKALEVSADTATVSPRVKQFCQDLVEDASLKRDYLVNLKSWDEDELSDDEIGYMLDRLSSFDSISSYLRSLLAARAGGGKKAEVVTRAPKKTSRKAKKAAKRRAAKKEEDVTDLSDLDNWIED
jgi:hypothetical protein